MRKILDMLFPPKCAGCNEAMGHIICGGCLDEITRESMRGCKACAKPPYLCECKRIADIDGLVFPYFYEGEKLKFAVYKLKRANLYYINEFFAKGMYNSVKMCDRINLGDIGAVCCVPRARKSANIYGYNQAEKLARLVAEYSGLSFRRALRPAGRMAEQKTLGRDERLVNVRGKFAIDKGFDAEELRGRDIMLVDDVATTGATLSECARALKEAGAGRVYAVCAAST